LKSDVGKKYVSGNNIAFAHQKRKSADRNYSMPHPAQRRVSGQL
jgi:hypothetical protein